MNPAQARAASVAANSCLARRKSKNIAVSFSLVLFLPAACGGQDVLIRPARAGVQSSLDDCAAYVPVPSTDGVTAVLDGHTSRCVVSVVTGAGVSRPSSGRGTGGGRIACLAVSRSGRPGPPRALNEKHSER